MNREELLAAVACQVHLTPVPGVGDVYIRDMSVQDRVKFNQACFGEDGKGVVSPQAWAVELISRTAADASGALLFSAADIEVLWTCSEQKLTPLLRACEKVNGVGAGSSSDAEKNSTETQSST